MDKRELEKIIAEQDKEIRRLTEIADALVNHCDKEGGECGICAVICCPNKDPLHFHHDGCPSCHGEAL